MKQFMLTMAGVFAALMLFFVGLPVVLVFSLIAAAKPAATPADTVLSLDLRQSLPDQAPDNPLAFLTGRKLSVLAIVDGLKRAGGDPAIKALLVRLPEGGVSPAAADEIRGAIKGFRAAGKPVIAFSQGLYPSGSPVSTYMIGASTGDGFWMQPQASLQATGAASEELFYKRAFDKYGLKADYQQRYQYKNAVNPLLYDDYTPAHREATLSYMGSIYTSELAAAAADRKVAVADLRAGLEAGPYIAQDALAKRLIDHVGGVEEAEAALKRQAGADARLLDFNAYQAPKTARAGGPTIAVIGAEGDIVTGVSRNQGLTAASDIRSDDLTRAFQKAAADRSVKAIVFRVSSPGGSDTASEQIGAAVRATKAAGKPVVVSMGTYAASGGYWISADASEIVAEPTTITGSIGVFGGKFVLGPALAKFGVDAHGLSVGGPYADAFGTAKPFTPAQEAAVSTWMDRIYAGFVARVAQGRRLAPERVAQIARGRVWTGAQARELGLVDRLGGFQTAVAEAKRLAGLPADREVQLREIDGAASPFSGLGQTFQSAHAALTAVTALSQVASTPEGSALVQAADRLRLQASGQALALAPVPRW